MVATCIELAPSTVRGHMTRLEDAGWIHRYDGRAITLLHPSPSTLDAYLADCSARGVRP
jgi:hypothetical protein